MRIALCALTYRRPAGLAALLGGIAELLLPDDVVVEVVIVDNDPDGSAAQQVALAPAGPVGHAAYVHEPQRGISAARNAAVNAARQREADAICFIDDDEIPAPDWLTEFVAAQRTTDADVVTGPVFPRFDEPPPDWVIEGEFFERPRHRHLERIDYATTSSVLIMMRAIADRPEPFDPAFGLSGGEDTHLFAQLHESGHTIVWCDTARVDESIPSSRVDQRWLLRREYRRGQTLSLSLRARHPGLARPLRRIVNALVQIVRGSAVTLIGLAIGRAARLRGVRQVAFGCGMITGLAGRRYQEYTTTHGN